MPLVKFGFRILDRCIFCALEQLFTLQIGTRTVDIWAHMTQCYVYIVTRTTNFKIECILFFRVKESSLAILSTAIVIFGLHIFCCGTLVKCRLVGYRHLRTCEMMRLSFWNTRRLDLSIMIECHILFITRTI